MSARILLDEKLGFRCFLIERMWSAVRFHLVRYYGLRYYYRAVIVEREFALNNVRVKLVFWGAFTRITSLEVSAYAFADIAYRLFYYSHRTYGARSARTSRWVAM